MRDSEGSDTSERKRAQSGRRRPRSSVQTYWWSALWILGTRPLPAASCSSCFLGKSLTLQSFSPASRRRSTCRKEEVELCTVIRVCVTSVNPDRPFQLPLPLIFHPSHGTGTEQRLLSSNAAFFLVCSSIEICLSGIESCRRLSVVINSSSGHQELHTPPVRPLSEVFSATQRTPSLILTSLALLASPLFARIRRIACLTKTRI